MIMMKIAVLGGGAMGRVLAGMIEEKEGFQLAGVIEPLEGQKPEELTGVDVIIDFSNPANLEMLVKYCKNTGCPAVIATTGYTEEQTAEIEELAESVPVVFSANYSLGINVMKRIIAEITPILEDAFDIEIIEKHHNKKLTLPAARLRCYWRQPMKGIVMSMFLAEKATGREAGRSGSTPYEEGLLPASIR